MCMYVYVKRKKKDKKVSKKGARRGHMGSNSRDTSLWEKRDDRCLSLLKIGPSTDDPKELGPALGSVHHSDNGTCM